MNVTFVYAPKSGSRVFAAAGVVVVTWQNGSCHVVHEGPVVRAHSAVPGAHWRRAGRELLSQAVAAFGGVAWDEMGLLCYAAPTAEAGRAVALRLALAAMSAGDWDEVNHLVLVEAGIRGAFVPLDPQSGEFLREAVYASRVALHSASTASPWTLEEAIPLEGGGVLLRIVFPTEGGEEQVLVKAPAEWGLHYVTPPHPFEEEDSGPRWEVASPIRVLDPESLG